MKKSLLTCTLLLLTLTLAAQTYHLEAVTTIVPNERYVFLQDGDAMSNTLVNKALQTTSDYQTQQLTGSESYVWRLVRKSTAKPLYTLQNCSLDDVSYLSYNTSGLLLTTSSKATQWMLHFQPDGTLVPHQVYDLQGRKLHSQFSILHSQFSKGIYIVNGKLVVK